MSHLTFRKASGAAVLVVLTLLLIASLSHNGFAKSEGGESKVLAQRASNDSSVIEKERQSRIADYMKRAKVYFANAEFILAMNYYYKALKLDPNNEEIKASITRSQDLRDVQTQLNASAPKGKERKTYIKSKYKNALELFDKKDLVAAKKELSELWLLAGDYKSTKKYLLKIDKDFFAAAAKSEKGLEAPVAVTKPEPAKATSQEAAAKKAAEQKALAAAKKADEQKEAERKKAEEKQKEQQVNELISRGNGYLKKQQYAEAIAECEKALAIDKDNKSAKKMLAKANKEKDAAAAREAERKQRELEAQKKEKVESLISRGNSLYKAGNLPDAKVAFEEALKIDESNKKAKGSLADVNEAIEKRKKQASAFEARLTSGKSLLAQKRYAEAIAEFEKAKDIEPSDKEVPDLIAQAKQEMALKEKTDKAAKEAAERVRQLEKEKQQKADAEKAAKEAERVRQLEKEKQQKADEAAKAAKEAERARQLEKEKQQKADAEKAAKDAEQARELEKEKQQKAEAEKAAKEAERVRQLEKEKQQKANELARKGTQLLKDGKYDDAIKSFDEALQLEPLLADAQRGKSEAEQKRAEALKAAAEKEAARKAEEQKIQQSKQLYEAALARYREKDFDGAKQNLQEALTINPQNDDAKKLLEEIASATVSAERQESYRLLDSAIQMYEKGAYQAAMDELQKALQLYPKNQRAVRYLELCNKKIAEKKALVAATEVRKKREESEALFTKGLDAYKQKDLEAAVDAWKEALTLNPENDRAQIYLKETKEEYDKYVAAKAEEAALKGNEEAALKKLEQKVTISTIQPTPLVEFLNSLSLVTGINFYVAPGVEARINTKLDDKPLREVLDTVLVPIGLKWERKYGSDIVTITAALTTKIFNLSPEAMAKVKTLLDNKVLQKTLWGEEAVPPVKGMDLSLNERESILIAVDSESDIKTIEAFLRDLKMEAPPSMEYRTYTIRPDEGPKMKALIEAMLSAETQAPYSKERKLLLVDDQLIVRDTPENIGRIEALLMDKKFIDKLREAKLSVETFNIAPKTALEQNPEQLRQFAEQVREVIETMLYSQKGIAASREEGRRLWFDPVGLQITVTDYPENLRAVAQFIDSLPQIEKKSRSKILFLRYAKAADLVSDLETALGISAAELPGGPATGEMIEKTLRVDNELKWRDISVRLTRVNENNVQDENDDSAEFVVNTPTSSEDVTITEYHSEFVDDYEISVPDIKPSGAPGEGRARVQIRYIPAGGLQNLGLPAPTPTPTTEEALATAAAAPISFDVIESQNAVLVRYTDPAKYAEVADWIELLDAPVAQVSIETKFVEVMENRAKELSSEFGIQNLGEKISLDDRMIEARFANSVDELRSGLEPPAESTYAANLLKGSTVIQALFGGASPINYQLRLLEAEGIINVVSGPHVLVENNGDAEFTITRQLGLPQVDAQGNYLGGVGITQMPYVDLSIDDVTITKLKTIRLHIDATIEDFDANAGTVVSLAQAGNDALTRRTVQNSYDYGILRKELDTYARVNDGGTIVVGGWTGERNSDLHSGIPVFRNIPYIGQVLFGRNVNLIEKTTLLIFLTCRIIEY